MNTDTQQFALKVGILAPHIIQILALIGMISLALYFDGTYVQAVVAVLVTIVGGSTITGVVGAVRAPALVQAGIAVGTAAAAVAASGGVPSSPPDGAQG